MCSYCGCESIEVVGRFMAEHVDIINATTELRLGCADGDGPRVVRAVDRLELLLHPHTKSEEVGLFAVLRRQEEFTEHVDSLCSEHTALDEQLVRIRNGEHALVANLPRRAARPHRPGGERTLPGIGDRPLRCGMG